VSIGSNSLSPVVSTRAARWARLIPAAIFAAVVLSGCGGSDKVTAPRVAASIVITAPSGQMPVAGTLQFTAVVKDADGDPIDVAPTWSVAHGGGTISSSGLFTAGDSAATFENTVVATSGAASSASTVTVLAGALASIVVTPATINLVVGGTQQFTAAGADAHGNVVAIPDRAWSIAAAGGTIDTSGMFTAGTTAGTFANTVTATSGLVSGSGSVTIGGGAVASIEITLDTASVAIGGTQQ
jgi:plastocyanin